MQKKELNFAAISRYRSEIMGIACLWVILHHFQGDIPFFPLKRLSVYGNAGVDIFLFISGIGLFFSFQKKQSLASFYKKRLVRLLLPYIFICVPFFVWRSLYLGQGNLWLDITQLSFPLSRMITTWYVPAILSFYLFFPLVYKLQNNKKVGNRNILVIFFSVAYLIVLLVLKNVFPVFYENVEIALTRFVIFFIGCYFGKMVYEKKPLSVEYVALGGAYIIIWVLLRETTDLSNFWIRLSYGPLAISISLLAAYLFCFLKNNNILLILLRFFGDHSLEVYLTHVLIYNIWRNILGVRYLSSTGRLDYLVVVAIAIVVSVIVHFLVSKLSYLMLKKEHRIIDSNQ